MRIVVLGATGATGRHVVTTALARGHEVVALARRPEALAGITHHHLLVRQGDVRNPVAVAEAAQDADALIGALGFSRGGPKDVLSAGARATRDTKVAHISWMGSFGVGASRRFSSGPHEWIQRRVLGDDGYDDKIRADELIAGPETTIFHPVSLTNGAATGSARVVPLDAFDRVYRILPPSISRADVAAAMVSETERPAHAGRTVAVLRS